jgi:hypothetical protein
MKCKVCGCTGDCNFVAEELCSKCAVIITRQYIQELIDLLKSSGINSKQKVIDELQELYETVHV